MREAPAEGAGRGGEGSVEGKNGDWSRSGKDDKELKRRIGKGRREMRRVKWNWRRRIRDWRKMRKKRRYTG